MGFYQDPQQTTVWRVIGEVVNNSSQPIESVLVTARLFNAAGALLGVDSDRALVAVVAPGADAPFDVRVTPNGGTPGRAEAAVAEDPAPPTTPVMTGLNVSVGSVSSSGGNLTVSGSVTNSGTTARSFVTVIVALKDADGKLVHLGTDFASPASLNGGQSGTYSVLILSAPAYTSIKTWVAAR